MADHAPSKRLIEKIAALPAERRAEVEDFVDFISQREQDRALTRAATAASAPALAGVWDNPEDAAYDGPGVRHLGPRTPFEAFGG